MTDEERVRAVTGSSSESFEAAAVAALNQLRPDGQLKSARIVGQEVTEGGVVAGVHYHVTLVTTAPPSNA